MSGGTVHDSLAGQPGSFAGSQSLRKYALRCHGCGKRLSDRRLMLFLQL
jgi:hypothetical protein